MKEEHLPRAPEGARVHTQWDEAKRWIPSLVFLPAAVYFLTERSYSLLDYFHLVVHEAGHFLLGFFGELMMFLGGTIMQIIIPVLLLIFCYVNYKRVLFQVSMFLLGHSFVNVSIYAADAKEMKLELFGPPNVQHDWNWILTYFGGLEYHSEVSAVFTLLACAAFLLTVIAPLYISD
ncbi:MAG: hypothetical protein IT279_14000 [Ignavibacteriaceae bacterium]|nr:hypothetical protein [Ignavibacteriaceae bacterium]